MKASLFSPRNAWQGFRQEREAASTAMSPHTAMRMDAQQHLLGMADEALQVMAVCGEPHSMLPRAGIQSATFRGLTPFCLLDMFAVAR